MTGLFTYREFSLRDTPPLDGKVALVTGGHGGIGREITAQLLIHDIDRVLVLGRNSDKFLAAKEEWQRRHINLGKDDKRVTFIQCDLGDIFAMKEAADQVRSITRRLDILICNGGMTPAIPPLSPHLHFHTTSSTN
ncbi:NAD(P)-binding protein [Aspergillus vadensis CBS 113365]|uniref:NAD(P)-binding protein n=1 Tax=Aspergillus vadensis (strain CBS 113365 / IMI 142717 / IBT 24658) TaxID=1448311 RepID=A0A319AVT8_ASPVC|nr:NAD(P)-binding protein [Aspergillus vadensis CBS 113365]PYH63481.1 NAD(P)-binding protein [Aspergillus vadensis CBS 113365]